METVPVIMKSKDKFGVQYSKCLIAYSWFEMARVRIIPKRSKDSSGDTYYSECKMMEHVLKKLFYYKCFTGDRNQKLRYCQFNLEKNEFSPENSNHLFYIINERLFYEMITPHCDEKYLTRCYVHKKLPHDPPVLILGRIKNYVNLKITLDEDHLKLCMKILAYFHADMMRLKHEDYMLFNKFCKKLYGMSDSRCELKISIREFMEKLDERDLGNNLLEKVKRKCKKYLDNLKNVMTDDFSTIIHGHFVRSKVMFKYKDDKPFNIKIVGWCTVKRGPPSFDFGSILLTNLPAVTNAAELETFYRKMLQFYLDNFTDRYSTLPIRRDDLEQNIIEKLLFSYINHHYAISYHMNYDRFNMHKMVLEMFDKLGSLN
ncbi:hypothetical protein DMN91_004968 [Ooceraea biroi]|uniref:CHK kinase-like domain-containing protein n=1 Tax=Ooceraea biroi TaxID=2015173 RepID=A0A3L8DQH3_OOCBI|nr:hypothetical protein DMN91_004968 [Ooceraea biroi]